MNLTPAEAMLVRAMLAGDCDYNFFCEGGDYADVWCRRFGVDFDAFLHKVVGSEP